MGKPTGFIEFHRLSESYEPADTRVKHYKEFVGSLSDADAKIQGARCMDCGIPFCNNGCPVNNIIPDWNDLVYTGNVKQALEVLHSTNNFPDFTGRICPAPCETACTLGINAEPVGIKSIEHYIIDKGWENGWIVPQPAAVKTGKKVAVVGSGPAGLAAAQQAEGVVFRTNVLVGSDTIPAGITNDATEVISADTLKSQFDAVILSGGSEVPRDLPVTGRELGGVHFALEFLIPQNKEVEGGAINPINVKGKHVIVIGGGDTGSDCVGTSNRHGAASVTQFEVMPMPPVEENKPLVWPYWPIKLRTSSSHEEGCERDFSVLTKGFVSDGNGRVKALQGVRLSWEGGRMTEIAGSEFELPADNVFLAMGFVNPVGSVLESFGVNKDARGNASATTDGAGCYATNVKGVFAAGDVRRGQSLVVWAIREGRQCAREVDVFLMGSSVLPR